MILIITTSHDESKIEPEIEKDLSNVSFDDKDDLEIIFKKAD